MDLLEKGTLLHFTPVHFISDLILSPEKSVVCLDVLKFGLRFSYLNLHVYTYILKFNTSPVTDSEHHYYNSESVVKSVKSVAYGMHF